MKAYEVVAEQLRSEILEGARAPGTRLSNEIVLAEELGVSRATVREALRLLGAENLIRTAKGAGGGSFVTVPSADHFFGGAMKPVSEAVQTWAGQLRARKLPGGGRPG